jgi:hypothetical protein
MNLDLTDEEAAALIRELHDIVENDHYPFSHRIRVLRDILAKLRPEPVHEPLPPPKVYAPPRFVSGRRRRGQAFFPGLQALAISHVMKSTPGPPMTLGNAAAARVRLIVWCRACQHNVEPDR